MPIKEYKIIEKTLLNHKVFSVKIIPIDNVFPKIIVSSFFYIFTDDLQHKRPYTPIHITDLYFEFAIKVYENGFYHNSCRINRRVMF